MVGDFIPRPPTRALPLDLAGGLSLTRPILEPSLLDTASKYYYYYYYV